MLSAGDPAHNFDYETFLLVTTITIIENTGKHTLFMLFQWFVLKPLPFYSKEEIELSTVVTLVFLEHTEFIHIETKIALKIFFMLITWNKNTGERNR